MGPIESRRTPRKDITLKGTFKIKDDLEYKLHIYKEPIELTMVDIAALGCGFVAGYYLPKGLTILVRLKDFPVVSEGAIKGSKDMEFTGRVMTCRTTPSRANRVGIEFVKIEKEDLSLIKRFIESKI